MKTGNNNIPNVPTKVEMDKARFALKIALEVDVRELSELEVYRLQDDRFFRFIYYTGNNYSYLKSYLQNGDNSIHIKSKKELSCGALYFTTGKGKIKAKRRNKISVTLRNVIAQNNHLIYRGKRVNLMFNFEIARFLVEHYPGIELMLSTNIADNKIKEEDKVLFTNIEQFEKIPKDSFMRKYKVFFYYNKNKHINVKASNIPDELIISYLSSTDFDKENEVFIGENNKKGIIAYKERIVVPAEYDDIEIENYRAYLCKDGKWALYYLRGINSLSDCQFIYDRIESDINNEVIRGYINENEYIMANYHDPYAGYEIFSQLECDNNFSWGMKKKGRIILECNYNRIDELSDGLFAVENDEYSWGLFKDDKFILPCKYDHIDYLKAPQRLFFPICLGKLWGIVSREGKIVVECKYEQNEIFNILQQQNKAYIEECYQKRLFIENCLVKNSKKDIVPISLYRLGIVIEMPLSSFPGGGFKPQYVKSIAVKINSDGEIVGDYWLGQQWLQNKE